MMTMTATTQFGTTAEALAQLAKTRDPEAWGCVLQRHGLDMLRVAYRITGDAALAEDVCQETLLQLRDFAGKFRPNAADPEGSARAWILHVTCNTALKLRRSRQRAQHHHSEAAKMQLQADAQHREHAEREKLAAVVRAELQQLPEAFQQALTLRYYGGLEVRDVAGQLSLSEEAARKRITRGVEQLRKRLAQLGLTVAGAELATLCGAVETAEQLSLSSHRLAQWKGLLTSPQHAALNALASTGGMTLMAKCAIGITALVFASVVGVQARKSWTSEPPPAPPISQTKVEFSATPHVTTTLKVTGDAKTYPYVIPIELGDQSFKPGDKIEIQEIRGTKPTYEAGGQYQLCGIYTLASTESASLRVHSGFQGNAVPATKGTAPFFLTFVHDGSDFPNVSFTTGALNTAIGSSFFGKGPSAFKAERLTEKVPFQLGTSQFLPGDSILVTSVESDRKGFEIGGVYRVSGEYILGSRAACTIAVFGTTQNVQPDATLGIEYIKPASKGTAKFSLTFKLIGDCWPHVSFYPAEGGNGLGGIYFGSGKFLNTGRPANADSVGKPTPTPPVQKDEF